MEKIYIVVYEQHDWPTDHYAFKNREDAHNKALSIFGDYVAFHMSEDLFEDDTDKVEFFNHFEFNYDEETNFIKYIVIKEGEGQYEEIYIEEVVLK